MRDLVDGARRERSLDLLRAGLSLQEVAARLGYAETTSFRRAFRRAYGRNPTEWRKAVGSGVAAS